MTDIHTHILSNIDDGPKTENDSLLLLKALEADGVTRVVSTSHFYSANKQLEEFVAKRDERLETIKRLIEENNINIRVYAGAEVNIHKIMLNYESLKPICFEGTNNILLEIPYELGDFEDNSDLIYKIMSYYNVTPIIAHIDRYDFLFKNEKNVTYLKEMGCVIQVDADCFDSLFMRARIIKMIKKDLIDVVASDCHNLEKRKPNLKKAYSLIEKKAGVDAVARLRQNASSLV
jgi:protein-tyrosine phosphatase